MKVAKFLLVNLLVAWPAVAGVVFEVETTYHRTGRISPTEILAEGENLKIGIVASAQNTKDGEMLFRGDRREMVVVDHDDKTYMVMDREMMQAMAGQVGQAMRQAEEAMKNVPQDQRELMEKMMKDRMPAAPQPRAKAELRKTSERADKNGYPCVKYDILRGGTKIRELWVTDWANIEGGKEVIAGFEAMSKFFRELADSIPQIGGQEAFGDPAWELMMELNGFPVVTREFDDDGSLEAESTLRSSQRRTLDPAEFEPPAGYKRRAMFPGG